MKTNIWFGLLLMMVTFSNYSQASVQNCLTQSEQQKLTDINENLKSAIQENPECQNSWGADGCLNPFDLTVKKALDKKNLNCSGSKETQTDTNFSRSQFVGDRYSNPRYYCEDGYFYGPNGLKKWSGDSNACENSSKVLIGNNYACFDGTLYGPNGLEKWSGDSNICGNTDSVKIGSRTACLQGSLFDQRGSEHWTGDSSYCSTHELP